MAVGIDSTFSQGASKYDAPNGTVVSAILKEDYLPGVQDLLNSQRILSRYMRRNSESVTGKYAVLALRVGRNEGVGFVDEGGKLPDPGAQGYASATYRMRYNYGRVLFTGPVIRSSRNDRGAFLRVADAEITGLAMDLQHENNRVMFGDGSGRLCQLSVVSTAPTYSVAYPGGFSTSNYGLGTQYLRPGMRVACSTGTAVTARVTSAAAYAAYIRTVDPVNGTVTFSDSPPKPNTALPATVTFTGATIGDFLYRVSERSTAALTEEHTGWLNEPFGLAAIVSDSDPFGGAGTNYVGNISATNNAWWQALVQDSSGSPQPFSQSALLQALDNASIWGDSMPDILMTTHGIRRQLVEQLLASKRYQGTMELPGGYKAVSFNGYPVVVDKDCTRGRLYGLQFENLMMLYETDYEWIERDGSILHRLENYDAYQACILRYWQVGTDARNRQFALLDIDDS